jgi:hypothetical protein
MQLYLTAGYARAAAGGTVQLDEHLAIGAWKLRVRGAGER